MNCPKCKAKMKGDTCSKCGYKPEDDIDTEANSASEAQEENAQYEDVFSDSPVKMVKVESGEEGYNEIDENNNVITEDAIEADSEDGFIDPAEIIKQSIPKDSEKKSLKDIFKVKDTKKLIIILVAAVVAIAVIIGAVFIIGNLSKGPLDYSVSSDSVTYIGDTVFFANPADSNKLYKMESNKGEAIKLLDESVKYLTTDGNRVYFSLSYDDYILCSIMPDGSGFQSELTEHPARYNAYFGKYLYYSNPYEDYQIYRMAANGEIEQITNAKGTDIMVTSHFVYFIDNGTLACVSLKNGERTDFIKNVSQLSADGSNLAFVSNNLVSYYENAKSNLASTGYSTNINNAQDVTIIKNGEQFCYLDTEGFVKQKEISSDETKDITTSGGYDFYYYMEREKAFVAIDYDDMKVVYIDRSGNETNVQLDIINPYRNSYAAAGNAVNEAYGATDGEYLYYLNYSSSCTEKVKVGDSFDNSELLAAVPTAYMACSDGYIYYADYSMAGLLYRIKPDGTQSTRITSDVAANVIIDGDWVYYMTANDDLGETYIRRASKDGLVTTTLVTANVSKMNVWDGWVYYSTVDTDTQTAAINRMATNGKYNEVVIENIPLGTDGMQIFALYEDRLYYKDASQGLVSCNPNGEEASLVAAADMQCFAIQDDIIYYSDNSENNVMKKMPIDGSAAAEKITDQISFGISVCGDKIIFASYDGATMDFALYCVGTDGSDLTELG